MLWIYIKCLLRMSLLKQIGEWSPQQARRRKKRGVMADFYVQRMWDTRRTMPRWKVEGSNVGSKFNPLVHVKVYTRRFVGKRLRVEYVLLGNVTDIHDIKQVAEVVQQEREFKKKEYVKNSKMEESLTMKGLGVRDLFGNGTTSQ